MRAWMSFLGHVSGTFGEVHSFGVTLVVLFVWSHAWLVEDVSRTFGKAHSPKRTYATVFVRSQVGPFADAFQATSKVDCAKGLIVVVLVWSYVCDHHCQSVLSKVLEEYGWETVFFGAVFIAIDQWMEEIDEFTQGRVDEEGLFALWGGPICLWSG